MSLATIKLPLPFRMLNTAGATLNALGLARVSLELDPLLQAASKQTGLTDFGDPGFMEGLRVLLASAERDADLHFIGRLSVRQIVIDSLVNRLLLTEAQKQTPEIFTRPLIPPLIILGLPRSGTTFLHRMLAEDPANHAPPYWELTRPLPLPDKLDTRRKTSKRALRIGKSLIADLDRKHFTTVDAPEEDTIMLSATFEAWYFWSNAPLYGYLDWYLTQDHERKYREYRAWLQVLQATHPGRCLVLKSPEHTGGLSALLQAVPEARPVQMHRDPVTVFASYVSLNRTAQRLSTNTLDVAQNTAANLHLLGEEARRNLSARDANPGAVLDVRYDDLVAEPEGTVRRVYEHYELPLTDAYQKDLRQHVEENPQGKHGVHRYATDSLGLEDDAVRARFAAYSERFGFKV